MWDVWLLAVSELALEVTEGHWKLLYHSKAFVRFPIRMATVAVSLAVSTQYTNMTDRHRTTVWAMLMHSVAQQEAAQFCVYCICMCMNGCQCRCKRRLLATNRCRRWSVHRTYWPVVCCPVSWRAVAVVRQRVAESARGRCGQQSTSVSLSASSSSRTPPHRLQRQEVAAAMTSRFRHASSSSNEPEPEIVRVSPCSVAAGDDAIT